MTVIVIDSFTYWWIKQVNPNPYLCTKASERRVSWAQPLICRNMIYCRANCVIAFATGQSWPDQKAKRRRRRHQTRKKKHLIIIHVYNFIMKMHFSSSLRSLSLAPTAVVRLCKTPKLLIRIRFATSRAESRAANERRDVGKKIVYYFHIILFHCRPFSFHQLLEADIIFFFSLRF